MKSMTNFDLFRDRSTNMDPDQDTGLKTPYLEKIFDKEAPKSPPSQKIYDYAKSHTSPPVNSDIPKDASPIISNHEGLLEPLIWNM